MYASPTDWLSQVQELSKNWQKQFQPQMGTDNWLKWFEAKPKADIQDLSERALAQGQAFFSMMEQALKKVGGGGENMESTMKSWLGQLGTSGSPFDPLWKSMGSDQLWKSLGGAATEGFGLNMEQFRFDPEAIARYPAFGFAREKQERMQQLIADGMHYQRATQAYNALIAQAQSRASGVLQDKLAERSEPGRAITSMRALYDLWVDASEEAFAEVALSDEFRTVYGELVNAQMALRQHVAHYSEEQCKQLGIPTRAEVNTIGQRLQQLRRQVGGLDVSALRDEVDTLKSELAELRAELAANKAAPVTRAAASTVAEAVAEASAEPTARPAAPKKVAAVRTSKTKG